MFSSLKVKIPLIIISTITIMIIGLLIILINLFSKSITNVAIKGFENISDGYAKSLDNWFSDSKINIKMYSRNKSIINYLSNQTEENKNMAYNELLYEFDIVKDIYNDLNILDLNGNLLISLNNSNINIKDDNAWNNLKNSNYDFAITENLMINDSSAYMILYKGIKNEAGNTIGVFAISLKWDSFNKNNFENVNNIGKSARLFLMNEYDKIIAHKDPSRIGKDVGEEIKKKNRGNINRGSIRYTSLTTETKTVAAFNKLYEVPFTLAISVNESEFNSPIKTITFISIIITIIILIITSIIIVYYITTRITNVLKELSNSIVDFSLGNLSSEMPSWIFSKKYSNNELGKMSNDFYNMQKKLIDILKSINSISTAISDKSSSIYKENEYLLKRVEEEAANLEETASSMEEFASGIKNSTQRSSDVSNIMEEIQVSLEHAAGIVNDTASNIEIVNESSTKIKNITNMIENISFQTNILALNAAVEAARAGEHGKGFAVVASEVRNLAQNAQTSVKEITDLIDDSVEKINKATDSVRESREIFAQLEEKIRNTVKLILDITSTMKEQSIGVEQVNKAIYNMDINTQKNASLAHETSNLSSELLNKSEELNEQVSFFKF
ncbi:methyl-accepting chemotaxis protein [Brachyspira murdochii]